MVVKLIGSLYLLIFVYICIDNLVLSVPELSFILFTHKNAISNYYSRRAMNELTKNVDNYMNQLNRLIILHCNDDNDKKESHKLYDRFHLSFMRLMIIFDKLTKDYEILCTGYDNSIIESFNLSLSEFDILRKESISIFTTSFIKFMDIFNKMKSNNTIDDYNYLNVLYGDLVLKSHAYIISMKSLYNILTLRSEECYISKDLRDSFYNMYTDVLIKLLNDSESNFHEYPFRIKNQEELDEIKIRFNKINNNHKNALIAIDEFFSSLLSKYRKMNIQIDDEKFNKSLKIIKKIHVYSSSFNINTSLFSIIIILVTVITHL